MTRRRFYTDLDEPPFVDLLMIAATEGNVKMKVHRHANGFFVSLNSLAWQGFHWDLWLMVVNLPIHEDISLETDGSESDFPDFPTVPLSEIQLLTEEEKKSNFAERNYIYRGSRVDFNVTREEAYQAYLRYCAMMDEFGEPRAICWKLFDNLWVQLKEQDGFHSHLCVNDARRRTIDRHASASKSRSASSAASAASSFRTYMALLTRATVQSGRGRLRIARVSLAATAPVWRTRR